MTSVKYLSVTTTVFFILVRMCSASDYCDSKFKSINKDDEDQKRVLHGLAEFRFVSEVVNDTTTYAVGVCGNATKSDPLAAVIRTDQNRTTVLGRVNSTNVFKGGEWMLMTFGSGDFYPIEYNKTCVGPRVAFVLFHCTRNISRENVLRFVRESHNDTTVCFHLLELHSLILCKPEGVNVGTVIVLLSLLGLIFYIIGGVLYRRLILGAKGLEQIPHIRLWTTLLTSVRDCCGSICGKKEIMQNNAWQNFETQAERDDDSLLSP